MLSQQEMFDKVARHLLTQNRKALGAVQRVDGVWTHGPMYYGEDAGLGKDLNENPYPAQPWGGLKP